MRTQFGSRLIKDTIFVSSSEKNKLLIEVNARYLYKKFKIIETFSQFLCIRQQHLEVYIQTKTYKYCTVKQLGHAHCIFCIRQQHLEDYIQL
jgi:hypothetical protein